MPRFSKIDQRYQIIKTADDEPTSQNFIVEDKNHKRFILKFLKNIQQSFSFKEALHNFKCEFSILKRLNHPHVAKIFDFGFDTRVQKYYFTTEYIEGVDFLNACKDKPLNVVEHVVVQVLRALHYLHSRKIYHLDLKPQNIVVEIGSDGKIKTKIVNLCMAAFAHKARMGTPAYMAPEMIRGGMIDGRTDLYSLGVMIYKVLSGENPFSRKDLKHTLNQHLHHKQVPPSQLNKSIPEYWDHILEKMLEKNPANRYSQAAHIIRDINFLSKNDFAIETNDTKVSYLPETGVLIARDDEWKQFTDIFSKMFFSQNEPDERLLIIEGARGTGKTRFLDEVKKHAQLQNIVVQNLSQFTQEDRFESFLLLIDSHEAHAEDLNSLVQRLTHEKCLIVWATESAPKNWERTVKLKLNHYTKSQIEHYLESVTGLDALPYQLVDEVYKRTSGNPLFVAEFVKSLIYEGVFYDESGKWNKTTFEDIKIDFNSIRLPESIEDYLIKNFNELESNEQEIIKWLSVNKNPVPDHYIKMLCPLHNLDEVLGKLVLSGILVNTCLRVSDNGGADYLTQESPKGSNAASRQVPACSQDQGHYFKNPALADLVYNTGLSSAEKTDRHRQLSKLYKDHHSDKTSYLYHTGHIGNDLKARKALLELGNIYLAQPNYHLAIKTYNEIIALAKKPIDDVDMKAFLKLGKTYIASQQLSLAVKTFKLVRDLIDNKSSDGFFEASACLIDALMKNKEMDQADQICKETEKCLTSLGEKRVYLIIVQNFEAYILLKRGFVDKAETIFLKTEGAWGELETKKERDMVHNNRLIEIYLQKQQYDLAVCYCLDKIGKLKKINSKYALAFFYYSLGMTRFESASKKNEFNVFETCIEHFEQCEILAREIQDYGLLLRVLNALGNIYACWDKNKEAVECYTRSLKLSQKIKDIICAAIIAYNLGRIYSCTGQLKEAYSHTVYAINSFKDYIGLESPHAEINLYYSYVQLADIFNKLHKFNEAHKILDKAIKLFNATPALKNLGYWVHAAWAKTYFAQNNNKKCFWYLKKATEMAHSPQEKKDLEKVCAKLNILK
ncbi:MAG: protein kinase [Deltaproteobacteria bacterium]|nr:protein kinase [Deltaproteobacteria bacterium]